VITDAQLAEWKTIAADAVPGPWTWSDGFLWNEGRDVGVLAHGEAVHWPVRVGNARFIAAARDIVPALIAEVERRRAIDSASNVGNMIVLSAANADLSAEVERLRREHALVLEDLTRVRGVLVETREAIVDGGAWGLEHLADAARRLRAEIERARPIVATAESLHAADRAFLESGGECEADLHVARDAVVDAVEAAIAGDAR
jgi:hypothetical protein